MKKITVSIVTWNNEKTIIGCLKSLHSVTNRIFIKEIIVVDNLSQDRTVSLIKRKFPQVKLLQNNQNLGFGKANNQAFKNITSEYIFLLNPDTSVRTNSFKKMVAVMSDNPQVTVIGPKLLHESGHIQREMTPFPGILSQILILLRFHRLPFLASFVYPPYNYELSQEAQHLMGAALLIRTKVLKEVKGFDENFFMWFEEADLLKRISYLGYKIIYYPKAIVFHKIGESTHQVNPLKRQFIWSQSLLYYFKKHQGWIKISLLVPFIILGFIPAFVLWIKGIRKSL